MIGYTFSIKKAQLQKAFYKGMELGEDDAVVCGEGAGPFFWLSDALDSGREDCPWGRLHFKMTIPANCVCYLYAAACNEADRREVLTDPETAVSEKKRCLSDMRCLRFINRQDVLLYELEGRYLWIAVEVFGGGAVFSDFVVHVPGDSFMEVFPEIYREKNSFFHRYLSIFSSIYHDFQEVLDHRADLLDVDQTSKDLLEIFLKWIGIDVDGGVLQEELLRTLLREAPWLIRYKGSANCLKRICKLFVGEEPTILERSLMQRYVRSTQQELYDSLYGESPYDVTLLFTAAVEEHKKEQLLRLLEQFKPIRCRLHLLFLENRGVLDTHTYLDRNAVIFSGEEGRLDGSTLADGAFVLR